MADTFKVMLAIVFCVTIALIVGLTIVIKISNATLLYRQVYMIDWLKNWTNSIIVALIIAVIFELIIPNGNNKKYIKMVINLYVLFVILNPLISKFTNLNGIDINTKDYEKYFETKNVIEANTSLNSDKLIASTAEKTLKDDIKLKLNTEGYKVTNISINIDNENGKINSIKLSVKKIKDSDKNNNIQISVNRIEEVNVLEKNKSKNSNIKKSEIYTIKKILSKEYEISEDNIEVN